MNIISDKAWYQLNIAEVSRTLNTNLSQGLSGQEVRDRLKEYGLNQLEEKKGISPLMLFLSQFEDFIIWVLLGAALISGLLSEWGDAAAIFVAVLLQAVMGFVQEYRAEKSLAALKKLAAPNTRVIRDGQLQVIPAKELVSGDIVVLEAGDHVPADLRLAETIYLKTQEASLTGESVPVEKQVEPLEGETALGDRVNSAFMGTTVTNGRGKGIVTATGMHTELGKIAGLIQQVEEEQTPLQKRLEVFGKNLVYLCLGIVVTVFLLELLRGGELLEVFMIAVSLAVAAIPEGLPAVVTIALSLGVHRMVRRHALIRRLPAVETLGVTSVICSDKTGTLTQNEMTVKKIWVNASTIDVTGSGYNPQGEFILNTVVQTFRSAPDCVATTGAGLNRIASGGRPCTTSEKPDLKTALEIAALCNTASLKETDGRWEIIGDPTEGALLTAAAKAGVWKQDLDKEYQWQTEIPFDAERKRMSSIYRSRDSLKLYIKGAPDIILKDCTQILLHGQPQNLTPEQRETILAENSRLAGQALRVLAVAYRPVAEIPKHQPESLERDLIFVGLLAMIDPPRPEVRDAVEKCRQAGIKVVMITGDHKETAMAIAQDLGFFKPGDKAVTGAELDKLTPQEFEQQVDRITVYARVSAEHKLKVVRAWKKRGAVVAMTGDGVNDAPAVKEADVGVAMGITGTEVTKEASDMVITDDNFASIVAAVEEGRGIYSNIKKFIYFLLSCNAGEVLVMFSASLFGLPIPLFPIQILWINLVTDGLPALALGVDPIPPGIMQEPVRKPDESILNKTVAVKLLWQGGLIALATLIGFVHVLQRDGLAAARTVAFTVLVLSQLFQSYNCRSETESIFKLGFFSNLKLVWATGLSFVLQLMTHYVAPLRVIFKTEYLPLHDCLLAIALGTVPLVGVEIVKVIKKHPVRSPGVLK